MPNREADTAECSESHFDRISHTNSMEKGQIRKELRDHDYVRETCVAVEKGCRVAKARK